MGPRFDGAPVVPRSEHDRIYAVHDAFVVRRGAVGIGGSEGPGLFDAEGDRFAAEATKRQRAFGDDDPGARQATIRQVAQNAQEDFAAGEPCDFRREALTGGVDGVGTHRVAHVVEQVHDEHGAGGRLRQEADFQVSRAAAQLRKDGVHGVRQGQQRRFLRQKARLRGLEIVEAHDLQLSDHHRLVGARAEAAADARQPGRQRGPRDDRRFLDHHGHQHVAAVHREIGGDAERQAVDPDDVLDHGRAVFHIQAQNAGEHGLLFGIQRGPVGDQPQTFSAAQIIKSRNTGTVFHRQTTPHILAIF